MNTGRITVISRIAVFCLFLFLPISAWAKTYKIRLTAGHPYAAAVWVQVLKDYYVPETEKRVAEITGDRVKFQQFYGGSLAKLGEVLESVEYGLADMGLVCSVFEVSKLYIFNYTYWSPFTTSDMKTVIRAHRRVVTKNPEFGKLIKKYKQKTIAWMPVDSQQMITKFPVRTLEDLKGKKLANGGPLIPWLHALGSIGVQSRLNEGYTSLQTGVYDGWATSANPIFGFKLYEPAPYFTKVDFGAFVAGLLTMNTRTWAKLPEDVKKIMIEVGKEYELKLAEVTERQLSKKFKIMAESGTSIYALPFEEKARWGKILNDAQVAVKTARQADAKGLPGTKILKDYILALEKEDYRFPYRPTL